MKGETNLARLTENFQSKRNVLKGCPKFPTEIFVWICSSSSSCWKYYQVELVLVSCGKFGVLSKWYMANHTQQPNNNTLPHNVTLYLFQTTGQVTSFSGSLCCSGPYYQGFCLSFAQTFEKPVCPCKK